MKIRSLGYRTDLIFPRFDGEVVDRGDYTVIRTRSNPTFYWGNFLLFDQPPAAGDLHRWRRLFGEEIEVPPATKHMAFGWDTTAGETGVIQPFLDTGFRSNSSVVLTTREVSKPPKFNEQIEVRRVTKDREWEGALEVQVACCEPEDAAEGYRTFKRRQMARWQAMTEAGLGEWFGAFVKDGIVENRIVGDLGVFVENGVGRFQSVGTHPDFRRLGICGTLVYEAARYAFEGMGAKTLVMVADDDYHAAKIYEAVGFKPTEHQIGLTWWEREPHGN